MELTPDLQEKKIFLIEGLKKTYKEQYDAIQPLPYIKDRLYCVDKVFVEGGIEVCLAPELRRGNGGSWERLESYKSVYTDFRCKSKRRIIQGEPGYGKSTLTLQLAYDWCNDVSDSPMNNVEILILLRLRQLGRVKSLFGAIKSFLLSHEPRVSKHEIEKIINSCSSVHITLDGYDEYPGRGSNVNDDVHRIIKMELFADFDVSLTTRYLPECLREETKRAKLTGFDDKARDEYIRKAVVGNNNEAVDKIKQRLYENSILADLCQVPLIFVMFAHMAHDQRDFMKFKSVTQFFKHIIRCFYDHLNRKRKLNDSRNNRVYLREMEHHQLDKIAFEGLNKENQQLSWIKTEFRERVGPESYHQYILIGILVEEDVVSDDSTVDNVLFTTEVRFYHKLFCEWYAAHHLVTLVKNAYDIEDTLRFLDPFDLQYLFRFACGLDPDAGKKLINHLKSLPGGDTFAILCILEQTGDVNEIIYSVKDLCSRDVKIKRGDSALLQRSTTQLLEIASKNDIPISCLHLDYSSIKFEGDTIILHSGISLPKLPTVEKIHIDGSNVQHDNTETLPGIFSYRNLFRRHDDARSANQKTLTEKDILNWFRYGMKCRCIKELMFDQLQLPTSVSPEAFTDIMKTRNIQVRWRPFDIDFHLDLQNGHWEFDDNRMLENIRSSTVSIDGRVLQQISTVQLLHVAHRHNIPISTLLFSKSFMTTAHETIILNNGIRITNLPPLQKIQDVDNNGCNGNTEQDIANILLCVIKGQHFNEICFEGWFMPVSLSSAFTNWISSLGLNVLWRPFDNNFRLDLQTGHWEVVDNQVMEHIRDSTVSIDRKHSVLQQRSTVQLLHVAHRHNIPISCLQLGRSFSKIISGTLILHSGLILSCPVSVKRVVIDTEKGREMTETEVVDILMFVQQSHLLKELWFDGCLLPPSFSLESIPAELKSRDIKVFWNDYGYSLDLQSGIWKVDDIDTVSKLCTGKLEIRPDDTELLQRCTIKLLENASYYDIPISGLHLEYISVKFEGDTIILHGRIPLPILPTVEKIHIIRSDARSLSSFFDDNEQYGNTRTLTEMDVLNWFQYGMKCGSVKELMFEGFLLPLTLSSESIPEEMQSRDIKVSWSNYGYSLNLQSGLWEVDDVDTVKRVCTECLSIFRHDSELLQRCTIKLLENASYHDIPISCLNLIESFSKIDAGDVIVHSGLRLSCPVSVKKVVIDTERGREMTGTEVVDILMFVQQSHMLKELEFHDCLLPSISSSEAILAEFKTRDIKVLWRSYGYRLNLQSGDWEVDDVETVRKLCTETVEIDCDDMEYQQRCTIKLLKNASYKDIPISCLHLKDSFSKIDAGDVILHSGLRLSCPVSVKKVVIFAGREMTETEVVQILMFVEQSHMLEELLFRRCLLPQYIPAESIPSILTSRNVKVTWWSVNDKYELNLQTGRWEDSETRQEITDTKYNDKKTRFHFFCRYTELLTGSESESEDEDEGESESKSEIQTESESDNAYNQ
ncbi:uncharacterized protein [Apostichopus japonicus]|uniref:uncharacterized protein isoform X6 n=1 Tax=Stichopus japonicus TaxID=307972 RepID=UPI003AB69BF4